MCNWISEEIKVMVWGKGQQIEGYPPEKVRKDSCGAWIIFDLYGSNELYGWSIDKVIPPEKLAEKGISEMRSRELENLRPINYLNSISKGTDYPFFSREVTSKGNTNVHVDDIVVVNNKLQKKLKEYFGL